MRAIYFILIVLISCQNRNEQTEGSNKNEAESKLVFQTKLVLGKTIMVKDIIGDSIDLTNRSLMLYSGYDCGSCVHAAFELARKVDSASLRKVLIVEIQSDKGRDQVRYDYHDYIFSDANDIIRKQLKYIKTPAIFSFNGEKKIRDVYFPENSDQINRDVIKRFLN